MITNHGLLYIEPQGPPSALPLIDALTRKMAAAFRQAESTGDRYRGFHICRCGGAHSDNTDWILPSDEQTNSLCVHYLAFHRDEVPAWQLAKIAAFIDEAEPTAKELQVPTRRRAAGERVTR